MNRLLLIQLLLATAFLALFTGLQPLQAKSEHNGPLNGPKTTPAAERRITPPDILNVPNDTTVSDICSIPPKDSLAVDDLEDGMLPKVFPTDTPDPLSIDPCMGDTILRIWQAIDSDGNITRDTQVIIVLPDTQAPTFGNVGVLDTIMSCESAQSGGYATWATNIQLTLNSSITDCSQPVFIGLAAPLPMAFNQACDTLFVAFNYADDCGNTGVYETMFITTDINPPVLLGLPPDTIQVSCDTLDVYLMNNPPGMVSAMDGCTPGLMPSYTQDTIAIATTCPDRAFDLRRTWAVSDSCGNLTQSVHIVQVRDLRGPTFNEPEDLTISCDADLLDLMITGTVLDTMDNCGGPINLTFSDVIFDEDVNCPHSFKINRTWTARDLCGNASLRPQIITVKDTIPPTFLVPADTTVNCGLENDFMVTGVPTMLMDNCDANLAYQEQPVETIIPGNCPNNFTIQRAWVVEDSCGNRTTQIQTITVIDTIAPMISAAAANRIITCMAGTNITQEFFNWINSNGNAVATDACTLTEDLEWRRYKAGTDTLVSMPGLMCPAAGDTILMQAVDFVVLDLCGNSDTTRAVFIVIDNSPPIINECPQDVVVETDPSVCEATFVLQPPLVEEECAADIIMESISLSAVLTAGPGQAGTTPVDPVELSFTVSNPLPINTAGDATLSISLINADAEGATEFFTIFGEDGIVLGRTGRAPMQCSNADTTFIIPAAKINTWALDGIITIRLEPNIPPALSGSFAINNICLPNSQVEANLSFNVRDFAQLRYQYKVNNGPAVSVQPFGPTTVVLPLGENTIMYYVSDCAGNLDSCVYKVRVEDREPPILACPTDISVGLDPGTCSAMVTLPFPNGVTDNCGVAGVFEATMPLDTADAWLVFREDPNLNDYLPDAKTYTFQGVAANAVGPVDLTLDLRGDFSTTGAFVRVFGDSGSLLGNTPIGTANCNVPGQAIFSIPADTFNIWAADGEVTFVIEPNPIQVPPGVPGHGINPCNPAAVSTDGDVDSVSYIFATLSYREITPFYFAQGATDIPYTQMSLPSINPTHEFNVGETQVSYVIEDQHGNLDTCTYSVFVIDNEPPTALCQATIVEINPSGLEVDTVSVMEFDAGSFDNCGIDTMYLTPNTFTCEQAGTTVNATLTVIDGSGNVSTCTRPIRIEAEGPSPTFSPGICGGDTLYLFANPPIAQGGVVYTYRWFNPNGLLVSTQQNPIIPNVSAADAGAYVLQITGLTGCIAQEVVNVTITNLPLTPTINTSQNVCSENDIVLNASIALNNAAYRWYEGLPPGNLLATTNTPQLVIPAPHQPGPRQYYMTIEANGCISEPSLPITVTATNRPIAIINNSPEITLCEGEPITLGTFVTGVTYAWSGPSGFASSSQFPTVISQSTLANAGVYQLVVTQNGCSSLPANLVVNMLPKPAQPALTVESGPICEGQTLALKALPSGAATYHWVRPNLSEFTTTTNLFLLPNATDIYEGVWHVYTRQFGCRSDNSNTVNVIINEVPNAMASADPPAVCQNTSLQLFAAPGITGATYQWTGPNNYTSVAQNPVINNISLAGQGNYRVRITTPQGCTDTAVVAVTVLPSARIDAVSNTAPACLYGPTNIALQATIFPPDNGSYTYQWSGPGTYSSIDAVAIIPNATAANNGNYQLVVFTGDGCRSAPASTLVNAQNAPPMPPIPTLSTATQPPFCSGDALTLSIPPYSASGVIYNWVTPAGPTATNMPTLTLPNLSPDDSGPYRLFVTANGCNSDTSFMLPVTVNAIPQAIALSNSPVCEGTPLQLTASAPTGAAYQWTGPFTSSLPSPTVSAADPVLHSGVYTLLVTVNGCTSAPSSTSVIVNEMPNTPLASNSGPVCISDLGAALALSVAPGSATSGATYTWYGNGDSLGMTQSLNFLLSDFANFPDGDYSFWVEASLNNCYSDPSLPTLATISAIPPDTAFAGIDQEVCIGQILQLTASTPDLSQGQWAFISQDTINVNILEPNSPSATVEGLPGGGPYAFTWSLSRGACTDFSVDTVLVSINLPEPAYAGPDQLLCFGDTIRLAALPAQQGNGEWVQSQVQSDFNIFIDDELNPATTVSGPGVGPGNVYVFTWKIWSECGVEEDDVFITVSDNNPFAGMDQLVCNDDALAQLLAKEPAEGSTGSWSSPDGALLFSNRDDIATGLSNLRVGDNIIVWTLDNGFCGESSRDTMIINYQRNPLAVDDVAAIEFAIETTVNVLINDEVPPNSFIQIISGPMHGMARVISDSSFSYQPGINYIGEDRLIYEVCSDGCECDQAEVILRVGEDAQCLPPNIITPNGDGINDTFTIPCLLNEGDYPNSQVSIFNRWGDEVYRSGIPYRNTWDGTYNGEDLPADTYFYIVNLGDGQPPMSGYLLIQR